MINVFNENCIEIDNPWKSNKEYDVSISHYEKLREAKISKRKKNFIISTLTNSELDAIDATRDMGPDDYLAIAKVKRIIKDEELAKKYNSLIYKHEYFGHAAKLSRNWLEYETLELTERLHHPPTIRELLDDFEENNEGLRFRIFYCLRYPNKVTEITNYRKSSFNVDNI